MDGSLNYRVLIEDLVASMLAVSGQHRLAEALVATDPKTRLAA